MWYPSQSQGLTLKTVNTIRVRGPPASSRGTLRTSARLLVGSGSTGCTVAAQAGLIEVIAFASLDLALASSHLLCSSFASCCVISFLLLLCQKRSIQPNLTPYRVLPSTPSQKTLCPMRFYFFSFTGFHSFQSAPGGDGWEFCMNQRKVSIEKMRFFNYFYCVPFPLVHNSTDERKNCRDSHPGKPASDYQGIHCQVRNKAWRMGRIQTESRSPR